MRKPHVLLNEGNSAGEFGEQALPLGRESGQDRRMGEQPKAEGLGRSSVEAYGSIIAGALAVVLPMNWWQTLTLSALIAALLMDLAFRSQWTRKLPRWTRALIALAAVAIVAAPTERPIRDRYERAQTQDLHGALPGYSIYTLIRVRPISEIRRKYIFDYFSDTTKASASLYISASDHFVLSVTDDAGAPYTLETSTGEGGLQMSDFVVLAAGVGVASNHTLMLITVNGKPVGSRTLPFPISFRFEEMKNLVLGGIRQGQHGKLDLMTFAQFPELLSEDDDKKVIDNLKINLSRGN